MLDFNGVHNMTRSGVQQIKDTISQLQVKPELSEGSEIKKLEDASNIEIPEVNLDGVDFELPEFELPDFELPDFNFELPSFEDLF